MTILETIAKYASGSWYHQSTSMVPREITENGTTLHLKELWGRVNITADKITMTFDEDSVRPKPTFVKTVLGIPISGTINSIEITEGKVVANTSLGQHQVWP